VKKAKKKRSNSRIWLTISIITVLFIIILILIISTKPPEEDFATKEIPTAPVEEKTEISNMPPVELIPYERRVSAPNFNLERIDGENLSLSSLKGKTILLDFTATWCYYCQVQAPQVDELYKKYSGKNFTVISIDCKEDPKVVREKYSDGKNVFPVVLDIDGYVASLYSIKGLPTFFLLDKEGKIAYTQEGYKKNMKEIVSEIIDYINEIESKVK